MKTYRVYAQDSGFGSEEEAARFKQREGEVLEETLMNEDTREGFRARIMVSSTPKEGYDRLVIQARGEPVRGDWYVKILERMEEEEEITVFEAAKLSERRGYMLRSMAEEEKEKMKKEIMTKELEERRKKREEIAKRMRGE